MIRTENPEIDVQELMGRIREEAARRKGQTDNPFRTSDSSAHVSPRVAHEDIIVDTVSLTRAAEGTEVLPYRKEYTLSDFLNFHDEAFIQNAYRGILRRESDSNGFAHFLTALREARFTKIEILGRLRFSPEGKMQAVRIKGLLLPLAVRTACRLPIFGYIVALCNLFLRLPVVVKNWERQEAQTRRQQQEQCRQINVLASQVESAFQRMQQRVFEQDALNIRQFAGLQQSTALREEVDSQFQNLNKKLEIKADIDSVQNKTDEIAANLREIMRQISDHKRNILDQQRRLALLLEEARKRLPEIISGEQIQNMLVEEGHLLDAFYVDFEDRFRGTREDIKKRLEVYLPVITDAQAGTEESAILDVGCGRGEFSELLEAHKLVVQGIDMNRIMVNQCKAMGLNVQEAEAIAYLRALKSNTLGAITGIHIIEHLPFKQLISLFDEALRVLKPGGVVIFETPNPENLVVGACNFYYDPTHLNPLPPIPMQFLMEARGFWRVEILRLQRGVSSDRLDEGSDKLRKIVNEAFFSAQDYALLGYKA